MAKLNTDILFKARVGHLLFYPLHDKMVLRTISGFTTEALESLPKYELSRKNASEFGSLSSMCKQVRLALSSILPKQNNLAVVNSLTKKMREALEYDTVNPRGERTLSNALATEPGRQLLKDYPFNPDTTIALDYVIADNSIRVTAKDIQFPKGVNLIGFRLHRLSFDFTTGENALINGEWVIGTETVVLEVPNLANANGVVFTILEAQFFGVVDGELLEVKEDRGKGVLVVGIG